MNPDAGGAAGMPQSSKCLGPERIEVDCYGLSDRGLKRPNNEDHFFIGQFGRFLHPVFTNISDPAPEDVLQQGYGIVVADGVGGHKSGEVASEMAIRLLRQLVLDTCDWILSSKKAELRRVMERMAERYQKIDADIAAQSAVDPELEGMATTMTLACSFGTSLILAHVGDSRAYLFRSAALHQLTRDHTLAQELIEKGQIEQLESIAKSLRNSLMRVMGFMGSDCQADVDNLTLVDLDQVLLCTDGLSDMVEADAIASILRDSSSAQEACQQLVAAALHNGGKDNITVALARYRIFPGDPTTSADKKTEP